MARFVVVGLGAFTGAASFWAVAEKVKAASKRAAKRDFAKNGRVMCVGVVV